ncbi:hypothetical protein D3C79_842470 [compost metagenome]
MFFLREVIDQLQECLECFFDDEAIFFKIVLIYQLVVVRLEIRAQRIFHQQNIQTLFDNVFEPLHGGVLGRRFCKLQAQSFEIDLADVIDASPFA